MELFYTDLLESTVDADALQIKNVSILGKSSKNNREYTDTALNDAVGLFEGVSAYANHRERNKRDVREIIGSFINVRKVGDRVKADLQLLKKESWLLEVAEKMPKAMGFSIDATAKVRRVTGKEIVESISSVKSVDLVDSPATVKGLFESENDMEEKELLEKLQKIELQEKALESRAKELDVKEKELELERKKYERNRAILEKIEKELPKEIITESFICSVQALDDDKLIDAVIKDRKHVYEIAQKPAGKDNTLSGCAKDGKLSTDQVREKLKESK
jgi:hypothetical protein